MSNEETTIASRPVTAAQAYGRQVETLATRELERVLGSDEGKKAAARVALAFRATGIANPSVYECDPASVAACVATSAMTSLMPGGPNPDCYLVPRRVKGNQQLNWMISHRGLIKLATRAGYTIKARPVYKGEVFEYEEGETIHIRHVPDLDRADGAWEDMRGVIVRCYRISDGKLIGVEYVSRAQIEKRRNQSDAYQRGAKPGADEWSRSSPWFKWEAEMSVKTAIKFAFSRGGIPIDDILVREALSRDEADAIDVTPVVVQPPESSPKAIAQRDRFDAAVGVSEEVTADPTSGEEAK